MKDRMNKRFSVPGLIAWMVAMVLAFAIAPVGPAFSETVTEANVAQAIASAKTAEDYQALAAYFHAHAAAAGENVKLHQAMLQSWEKSVSGKSLEHMRQHCRDLIESYRKLQKENEALARQYESMAKGAGGT